jgi:hypothetical protein
MLTTNNLAAFGLPEKYKVLFVKGRQWVSSKFPKDAKLPKGRQINKAGAL